ncbi:hypothetical protein D9758_001744 [Tetrapyrgos nigripes]|uniref:25S rRNA adenine-N(1) methyltransferase n=1 Tax=Tetrapyrgos nigripes TaxID=182062 RepID=A0A8H5GXP9_9AGAR|nr:hypothetical protein D9758_001744 [Tetrapyrgos nigripes]
MPKARKKKIPLTAAHTGSKTTSSSSSSSSSKPESSRTVIRRFHVLLKQQTQLQKLLTSQADPLGSKASELADVQSQIDELGGLEKYQRMSTIGQGNDRGGGSEKIFVSWLRSRNMHKLQGKDKDRKLKLLEVGALKPNNYASCSTWIDNTPMDLHSRHPAILEQDFLLLNEENHEKWDLISLSLVLNFVPDALNRGRMLRLAYQFLLPGGHLFVALPLSCLSNSRYLDFEHFNSLMTFLGFEEIEQKWRKGGKMVYFLFRKLVDSERRQESSSKVPGHLSKKVVKRQGNRNNFAILL